MSAVLDFEARIFLNNPPPPGKKKRKENKPHVRFAVANATISESDQTPLRELISADIVYKY